MLRIYVIGCGGIGGFLLNLLPQTLASISLDYAMNIYPPKDIGSLGKELLRTRGIRPMPCVADELVLVDGDTFDGHNALRQAAGAGSKLAVQLRNMRESQLFTTWLQPLHLAGYNNYITPANMINIIPVDVADLAKNSDNAGTEGYDSLGAAMEAGGIRPDLSVVFLCVDNHKTRYEVSKYMELFENCLVINGGNEKDTGNVTVYERRDNVPLDPPIYEIYPEINCTGDKRPDEVGCTEMTPTNDQTSIINSMIAGIMLATFAKWLRIGNLDKRQRNGTGIRQNEVIVSLKDFSMMSLAHVLKNQEGSSR